MSWQLHLELLKEKIIQKYGHEVTDHAECSDLAHKVCIDTRKQLSASTIKRMFGLIKSNTNLSKHTLNVFALYVGYKDWDNFLKINNLSSDHFWNKFNYLNEITSKILLIEFDRNATIKDVNEVVEKFLATKRADLIGKKYSTIFNKSSENDVFADLQKYKKYSRIISATIKEKNNLLAEYFYPIFTNENTLAKVFYLAFLIDNSELDINISTPHAEMNGVWERIQEAAKIIGKKNLQTTKQVLQLEQYKTIDRKNISTFLEEFYDSDKIFTALVAPKAMGKSTALIHWLENAFFSAEAPHKKDIVLYLDFQIILNQDNGIWGWIKSEIEYYSGLNISETIFAINFYVKHKIVIVVENLSIQNEKQAEQFIDELSNFLFLNNRKTCFKIIFSFRNYSWLLVTKALSNIPVIKELWYGVDFDLKQENFTNITLFNKNEIEKIINVHFDDIDWNYFIFRYKYLFPLMKYPFFLDFFIKNFQKYSIHTEILFYKHEIKQRILSGIFNEQKVLFLKSLIKQMNWGKTKILPKKDITHLFDNFPKVYPELIDSGIIDEYQETENLSLSFDFVRINYDFLFEYILSCHWFDEKVPNLSNFIFLVRFYKNEQTGINILTTVLKSAMLSGENEKIKILITSIWSQAVKAKDETEKKLFQKYFISIIYELSSQLILNDLQQEKFLSLLHHAVLNKQHFFEFYFDIDILGQIPANKILHYISIRRTAKAEVIGKIILLFKYFFENKKLNAKQIAAEIVLDENIDNLYIKTLLACGKLLINQENNIQDSLLNPIYKFINYQQPESEFFVERAFINFWILETFTLKSLFKPIIKNRDYFFQQEHTGLFIGKHMIDVYLANAYLHIGDLHRAQIINKKILKESLSEYEYFQNMRFHIFQYHLKNQSSDFELATAFKQKAVEIAQQLNLKYFQLLLNPVHV